MELFHGSNVTVEFPRLLGQKRGLDFGAGFYLTSSEGQAARFSEIICGRRGSGRPTVNVYEFDLPAAEKTLLTLKFGGPDAKWLDFVVANRLKAYQGEEYDAIVGAVANDDVMPTIFMPILAGF
jgi:hypothetical protein